MYFQIRNLSWSFPSSRCTGGKEISVEIGDVCRYNCHATAFPQSPAEYVVKLMLTYQKFRSKITFCDDNTYLYILSCMHLKLSWIGNPFLQTIELQLTSRHAIIKLLSLCVLFPHFYVAFKTFTFPSVCFFHVICSSMLCAFCCFTIPISSQRNPFLLL